MTRTSSSATARSNAASSSLIIRLFCALAAPGRFNVIVAIACSASYRIVGAASASEGVVTGQDRSGDLVRPDCLVRGDDVPKRRSMSTNPVPETRDVAQVVAALIAPVVACLRGDDEGVRMLLDDTCDSGTAAGVLGAAPAVVRVYLRLAPPPDGA